MYNQHDTLFCGKYTSLSANVYEHAAFTFTAGQASGTSFYLTYMENTVEYPQDFDLELYVAVVGSTAATVNVRAPLVSYPEYNIMTEVQPGQVQAYGLAHLLRNVGQGITGNTIFVR